MVLKQCEQGGLIILSLRNSNEGLPFTELHTDRLSGRHSEDRNCDRVLLSDREEQFTYDSVCVCAHTGIFPAKIRKVFLSAH